MIRRAVALALRAPRRVLAALALAAALMALVGVSAPSHLSSGGFVNPNAPSSLAGDLLQKDFNVSPGMTVLVQSPHLAASPVGRRIGLAIVAHLRELPNVYGVVSYWTAPPGQASLYLGSNGNAALVNAQLAGDLPTQEASVAQVNRWLPTVDGEQGVSVKLGGEVPTLAAVSTQADADLRKALVISLPLLLLLLWLAFGSLAASIIPLAISGVSLAGALCALRIITAFTPVSVYALNMTSGVALALGVDYSLLLLGRYREERGAGWDSAAAISRAAQTAGRTVLFSAVAVVLCMSALLVFPLYAISSMAYAGIATVCIAAATAIIGVPAAVAVLARHLDTADVTPLLRRVFRRSRRAAAAGAPADSFFRTLARVVVRHPIALGLIALEILFVLGVPFIGARYGPPDDRVLPPSAAARQVGNVLRAQFQPVANEVTVLLPDTSGVSQPRLAGYARALSELPQVIEVSAPGGEYEQGARLQGTGETGLATQTAAYLLVYATGNPFGSAGQSIVSEVEHAPAPAPFLLTGTSPTDRDMLTAISDRLPEAVLIIGLSMFLVLFLFTGSVLLPIKAMVLNTLSLTASFGALAWIFQDGHWASVFSNGAAQGFLIPQVLVLIFVISFGISMDYEVFLMSRIREEWLAGDGSAASNIRSVEAGLIKAGPIISRAALLMAVVFATMLTAELSVLKMLGLGLCLAVTMDATVVRGVAVPAFMCILGKANWWLPPWLRRLHAAWGWSDESRAVPEAAKDLV